MTSPSNVVPVRRSAARPALLPYLVAGVVVFGLYALVTGATDTRRTAAADRHAHQVYDLQRRLHLDPERALNSWLVRRDLIRQLANYEYALGYLLAAGATLVWVYLRRPGSVRWCYPAFLVVNVLGIVGFAVYPLTPPRKLPSLGFVDTVSQGHTVGSWGTPLVNSANEIAAMPSLHVAWAGWVSVVLACEAKNALITVVGIVHLAVTLLVIMSTANHFLLDAVGGGVVVVLAFGFISSIGVEADVRPEGGARARVSAADAFFVHVETAADPQHVGGLVVLDWSGRPRPPEHDDVVAVIKAQLAHLPRLRQQLAPPHRWRRLRWEPAPPLDWDWHVPTVDLRTATGAPGGRPALDDLVADIQSTRLPRDRPLWRLFVVHGVEERTAAVVFVVHHVVADGFGTITQALRLLEPQLPAVTFDGRRPGRVRLATAIAVGLAQLATDGRPHGRLASSDDARRGFVSFAVPLDAVRNLARARDIRVTDVLLAMVAGGLRRVLAEQAGTPPLLRMSIPLMVRAPGAAIEGNVTAAVMLDVPLQEPSDERRLATIAGRTNRLRRPSRALASRFVMDAVGEAMPPPAHRRFARTVYGHRHFHAIVSNMPGPDVQLSLAAAPIVTAYPILPLAPGSPLAVGAMGWNGALCFGVSADPALIPDMTVYRDAVLAVLAGLSQDNASVSASRR